MKTVFKIPLTFFKISMKKYAVCITLKPLYLQP
jgi:hypothetical protein